MQAEWLACKEQAVEAMTRMNLLRKITEQLQTLIAQKELQALTFERNGNKEQALHTYQESCVYGQNLKQTQLQLEEATLSAEKHLSVFQQKEARIAVRISPVQSAALAAIRSEYVKTALTEKQMQKRIMETAAQEQWETQFAGWVQNSVQSD